MLKRNSKTKKEIKKVLQEAETAIEDFRLLDAARLYILASNLSKDIGEFESAREYTEKADELRKREEYQKKRSQSEKQRIQDSKNIKEFENELNTALEIAEVAVIEGRWTDSARYYNIAADFAKKMGALERYKAYKEKAKELTRRIK